MRTGEVFALTWDDIDLYKRTIKINKTAYTKEKSENGRWYLGTTKTIGSAREVYICDTLFSVLSDYKKLQNKYKKEYGKIIHKELGINCRFYDLRGSFATICLRSGCEIKDIAEVLGHKRIETTEKYYILSSKEDKIKVTKIFKNEMNKL